MSKGWNYKSGDWLVICDSCSKKIKASKSKERWDGFRVCSECWEPRHPMDFIRARADKISVPFTRPQPEDQFVSVTYVSTGDTYCTPTGKQAIPGVAIPGCFRPSVNNSGL